MNQIRSEAEGREHGARLAKATHAYVGILPCGCCVAAVVDTGDKFAAADVARFIREGLKVERQTVEWVRENLRRCVHQKKPAKEPDLPLLAESKK